MGSQAGHPWPQVSLQPEPLSSVPTTEALQTVRLRCKALLHRPRLQLPGLKPKPEEPPVKTPVIHMIEGGAVGRGLRPGAAPCKFRSWRRRKKGFLFLPCLSDGRRGRGFSSKPPYQPGICLGCSGGGPHLAEPPSYGQGVQWGSPSRPRFQGVCPGVCGRRCMQVHACSHSPYTSRVSLCTHLCAWQVQHRLTWSASTIALRPGPHAGLRTALLCPGVWSLPTLQMSSPWGPVGNGVTKACVKPWVLQGDKQGSGGNGQRRSLWKRLTGAGPGADKVQKQDRLLSGQVGCTGSL